MAKINYTKIEKAFDNSLRELFIEHLTELASLADLISDSQANLSSKMIEDISVRFLKELKKLKKQDAKLYQRLNLTPEDEQQFKRLPGEYTQNDWLRLKSLKERIGELKRELYGNDVVNVENDHLVEKERRRHKNKRFNIREGWLPLQ